jgi:hypothetical protein
MYLLNVRSLFRNSGRCYINYVLTENLTKTMYVYYRKAWEKSFSHTEICLFIEALPLSMYNFTTLMHIPYAPSPTSGIIS